MLGRNRPLHYWKASRSPASDSSVTEGGASGGKGSSSAAMGAKLAETLKVGVCQDVAKLPSLKGNFDQGVG